MTSTAVADVRGHRVYSPLVLRAYDWIVHGLSNRLAWKCPTTTLLNLFQQHVTANHLDVGVGTGYFLNRLRFPIAMPRLVLLDANRHCLACAARRLSRYHPACREGDILQPLPPVGEGPFDSISLNYVLHCLPGSMAEKARVFDHLLPFMNPGAVLFGATLLGQGTPQNWLARKLMAAYNGRGIFHNQEDTLDHLRAALTLRFRDVAVEACGCAALFSARR